MHLFHIPGMTCGGCPGAVTRAIQKLDPKTRIEGSLEDRTITVAMDKAEVSLLAALENAGYPAQAVSDDR
ncbi:copper chaperone [Microvirga sp. KLBC 81]|uniref:heavy-metal-associated domain-containing protein n=1 Tax=Microvirga sp. KLBC 81 TaxID=1862707 RepID=UPI000D520AB9|nr:heavy-metal-associated domain-containing protein [Microvirga sp. KLBC 81]PVE21624.1 copper chaperone [Microvirga sp. KLBC 81]